MIRSPATGAAAERGRRKERVDSNRIPSLSNPGRCVGSPPRPGPCGPSRTHLDLHAWHALDRPSRTACSRARKVACQAGLRDRNAANPLGVGAGPPSSIWRSRIHAVFLDTSRHSIHKQPPRSHSRFSLRRLHPPMISGPCRVRFGLACDKPVTRVHTPARGGRKRLSGPRRGLFAPVQRSREARASSPSRPPSGL